jgi:hypothetical protein
MTLVEALADAAAGLDGVEAADVAGTIEWRVRGRAFAAVSAGTAEFRLAGRIAAAALGTPDTAPSGRGGDWVAFRPPELDRFALDRATAWLTSAWRHALD